MAHEVGNLKKQRPHVFTWLHAVFGQGNDLQNRAHALAAALVIHADADGTNCYPGMQHLMDHTNQSLATVYRAKDDLVAAGLLAEWWDEENKRRVWSLLIPDSAVTSCRKVLTGEKTDSHSREDEVLTSENIPTQVPTHEPAQDLADARSSGEPESAASPEAADEGFSDPEIAKCDRDEAAIEAKVGGFRNEGEERCVSEMLDRGKSRRFIVNTLLKRRPPEDEWGNVTKIRGAA